MSKGRPPARVAALRLIGFYVASFAALAVMMTYWPLWLAAQGCTEYQVGTLSTALIVARTLAGPLWAQRADRRGGPGGTLRILSVLSLLSFLPFVFGGGIVPFLLWTVAFGLCYPPIHPLLDSLTISVGREQGFAYGRIRLWGSASFLAVTVVAGLLLEAHGPGLAYWVVLLSLVATVAAGFRLPAPSVPPPRATGRPILELLRSWPFVLFVLSAGLIQASHAAFHTYGAIHWKKAGIGEQTIGWLVAEGVVAEVLLFRLAVPLVARVPAVWLIALGAVAAVVRWSVLAVTTDLGALIAVQWLHALTFGATHLGALKWISEKVARDRVTTAQGLLAAVAAGACNALATALSSAWYPRAGASVFFGMAGLALLGGAGSVWLARKS